MSSQDYDELEKIYSGSWKYDRDENLEAFFTAVAATDNVKKLFDIKPVVIFSREGNSLKEKTVIAPGVEFDAIFKLNETLDWKEGDTFHWKVLPKFKDGVFTQDVSPQLADDSKNHHVKIRVEGNELIAEFSLSDDSGVLAKRIYKKC